MISTQIVDFNLRQSELKKIHNKQMNNVVHFFLIPSYILWGPNLKVIVFNLYILII